MKEDLFFKVFKKLYPEKKCRSSIKSHPEEYPNHRNVEVYTGPFAECATCKFGGYDPLSDWCDECIYENSNY